MKRSYFELYAEIKTVPFAICPFLYHEAQYLVGMIFPGLAGVIALLLSLSTQSAMVDILPFEGSTLTLLVIAGIAIVVLAILRLLVPVIIVGIIIIVLLILIFGGIPVPS